MGYKHEVIEDLMRSFGIGATSVTVERWTFVFNPFSGYAAANLGSVRFYSSFDDLAGMVEDMFNDGCFE
jgi:hypothetical protein